MRKLLSATVLCWGLFLSTACEAALFKVVGTGDGYIAFIDSDSATKTGSVITYDLLFVTLPPRAIEGQLMHYMIQHQGIDCGQETLQILSISAFTKDGKLIDKDDTPVPPDIIFPNSLPDSQMNLLCRGVKPKTSVPEFSTLAAAIKAGDDYIQEHIVNLTPH